MQSKELIKYIKNPELLNKEAIPQLQQLVKDFPYFQSGYILLSLAAKKWDASVYQQSIKKTAIVVSNREHLYRLIQQTELEPETIERTEEINKKEEPVTETVETSEPQKEIVAEKTEQITPEKTAEKQEKALAKDEAKAEEIVEKEIEKSLVNAFVEKEILHTDDTEKTRVEDKPSNFADWLKYLKNKQGAADDKETQAETIKKAQKTEAETSSQKAKQKALIDKIIESNPGIIRHKEEQKFYKSDQKAKESLLENEHLVTETLAQIYALQGSINKAIRAYEILSLKYPQKSAYFASLIQKLREKE